MTEVINDQDYSDRAAAAIANPGVWTTLREGQASANLVTRIRSGAVTSISPTEFEVRSVKIDGRYDVEIRTHVAAQLDVQRIVDRSVDQVIGHLQAALATPEFREVIRRSIAEVVIEETR